MIYPLSTSDNITTIFKSYQTKPSPVMIILDLSGRVQHSKRINITSSDYSNVYGNKLLTYCPYFFILALSGCVPGDCIFIFTETEILPAAPGINLT